MLASPLLKEQPMQPFEKDRPSGRKPLARCSRQLLIAGHRDTRFRVLKDVLIGDEIRIDRENEALTYRIVDVRIVSPRIPMSFERGRDRRSPSSLAIPIFQDPLQ
jgi:hypothetical protein